MFPPEKSHPCFTREGENGVLFREYNGGIPLVCRICLFGDTNGTISPTFGDVTFLPYPMIEVLKSQTEVLHEHVMYNSTITTAEVPSNGAQLIGCCDARDWAE